jgi:glycerate kinase
VLIAPQEMKGSLTAAQAAEAIATGLSAARPEWTLELLPIADGGPGTLDFIASRLPRAQLRRCEAADPLGRPVQARWLMLEDGETAVIEMAEAAGLWRVAPAERRILESSTRGVGQLIRAALDAGCRRVIIGAGGSATNDAGAGAAWALGVRFFDAAGQALEPTPAQLERCARLDTTGLLPAVAHSDFEVWADVRAPLLGEHGATRLFGPQKGASAADLLRLEHTLARLEQLAAPGSGAKPGLGAAGGLAWGLSTWCGAATHPGFWSLAALTGFDEVLKACDRVLTAEGCLDVQSEFDKGPWALAKLARRYEKPTTLFAGRLAIDVSHSPFEAVVIVGPELPQSTAEARHRLTACAHAWAEAVVAPA